MLFSSISFLYYFFAGVLALYFILPFKIKLWRKKNGEGVYFEAKNFVLLIASLLFYFYGAQNWSTLTLPTFNTFTTLHLTDVMRLNQSVFRMA